MTEKQKIFADEYLIDLNATRAYRVAYPTVKKDEAARANASRLLTNANVKKYISDQLEKIHNQKTADAQEVIEYLTSVLRGESTSQENAEELRLQVEVWMLSIPFRMQRIIKYKIFEDLTWQIGWDARPQKIA